MATSDEAALVEAVRAHDGEALGKYVALKERPLMAFIHRTLGENLRRKVEPEDIFQEVAADAVRSLDDIDLSERDPFNWLCDLCNRRIVDAHRYFNAQKRDSSKERPIAARSDDEGGLIDLLVASLTSPSQAFRRNAREQKLLEAVAQLPELQQQVLTMRYVEGKPSKEIAKAVDKSDASVRVMLTRTIKKLQSLLEEQPME